MADKNDDYGLSPEKVIRRINAPTVDYLPPKPKLSNHRIGIIGAGGISDFHLKNYRACDFDVVAIANRTVSKAAQKRDRFYPAADIYQDYKKILERDDIEVVDITPHPLVFTFIGILRRRYPLVTGQPLTLP
jgi:hypothetical protein